MSTMRSTRLLDTSRVPAAEAHAGWRAGSYDCGTRLASASWGGGAAGVWDAEAGAGLAVFGGLCGWVRIVGMSEDAVAPGPDKTPRIRFFGIPNGCSRISSAGAIDWVHERA